MSKSKIPFSWEGTSNWEIAIYEDKDSENIVRFANSKNQMSVRWWKETKRLSEEGLLFGVYQVTTGLRRTII
jgi:hypothetical protein